MVVRVKTHINIRSHTVPARQLIFVTYRQYHAVGLQVRSVNDGDDDDDNNDNNDDDAGDKDDDDDGGGGDDDV